jgi:hypothetical protein
MVKDHSKRHTIRARRKTRPGVGETCHCYTGLRTKRARLLGRWPCVKVEDILIYERGDGTFGVVIDGIELGIDEKNALAWRDGFRHAGRRNAFASMMIFWKQEHGRTGAPLDFSGDVIHWNPEVAAPPPGSTREYHRAYGRMRRFLHRLGQPCKSPGVKKGHRFAHRAEPPPA